MVQATLLLVMMNILFSSLVEMEIEELRAKRGLLVVVVE
jgi:hypothetical protein